ncbi:hypothetical protein POM88_026008 [Heracleum sosnowskyi]|uniref:Uncharacterized protein n=1 Tax=Heracleum sosnowskyi TaxID=360622 RepID=A0AAD8MNN9_9APIA|nr:hypothetical protein POM88_026008 [Heracleum sosnowskyi]
MRVTTLSQTQFLYSPQILQLPLPRLIIHTQNITFLFFFPFVTLISSHFSSFASIKILRSDSRNKIDFPLSKSKTALNSSVPRDPEIQVNRTGVVSSVTFGCEEQSLFHDVVDCERFSLLWKTENFLDNMDTHGWRINGAMDEYSDPDGVVIGPSIEKCTTKKCTSMINLDMTSHSSIEVAEALRKKRGRPRKSSVASTTPVNAVK